ncbi:secretion protein HlyD family protein [Paludibacter propionicigenes WB4]|uniref:Secretion protein HlyD family protein n=1 Tax=Paludibacter propionicigenes (strain DSM 17365 / JCM 13257 / WB4) TaxID=694427 RepID=E4T145_PALPW|nr:HlyD family secretion protein [Paludibacter propionicigenes]ADQ78426.1 secretion protein HlyD family protein [Paludibacter propionicigenes WB4]
MKKKKDWKIYIPLGAVILLVVIGSIYWYIDYASYIKTDDAVVASDNVSVSPKIMGRISKQYVEEGDSVKEGQLLAEIDSVDLLAQKQQVLASKVQTEANKVQTEAKYQFDQKNIKVLEIALEKAKEDFARSKAQYSGGVTTKEQYEHSLKTQETAQAQLDAAKAQLLVSKTQIKSAETAIASAQAQIGVISTQLSNTRLYAPVSGVVAKRWLLAGDIAQPSQSIYTINNNSKFWILVYLEETKMETLHVGQKAKFTLDTYPDVVFTGKVFTVGSTTASQFSLIPPNNASGNFTKVTQRVAIKISIDGTEGQKQLSSFKLLTGMSAVVKIIK